MMKYNEVLKAKYDKEEQKISISVAVSEDFVITRKVTVDEFKRIMAHMNSVLYDIENF